MTVCLFTDPSPSPSVSLPAPPSVIFRTRRQTVAAFRADLLAPMTRRRTFGGMVLVLGGAFTCMGCESHRMP